MPPDISNPARLPGIAKDLAVCACFVLLAAWVTSGLWPRPDTRFLTPNANDQILHEWFLGYESGVWRGDFHLVTDRLNFPDGVNLMANTSIIGLGILFAPVTAAWGAPTAFALVTAFNLAATAIAWYLLFACGLGARRAAAAAGAAFCGFAPGMISQSNAHPGLTTFLVPAMVWSVVAIARAAHQSPPDRRPIVRAGAVFGLLIAVQIFLGEEVMFLTALTFSILAVAYMTLTRPARSHLLAFGAGLAVAAGVASCLLAYPLWKQFAGPQSISRGLFSPYFYSADLASYPAFSPLSIAGTDASARLAPNLAELSTFLGWPLLLLLVGVGIGLRKDPLVQSCLCTLAAVCALSLGPQIVVNGHRTNLVGPFWLLMHLPVVDLALPLRFGLVAIPLVGTVLVLALTRMPRRRLPVLGVATALALLPLFPRALPTSERPLPPRFYREGHWRECVRRGEVIVPVPLPTPNYPEPMRYSTAALARFAIPQGYFIGPDLSNQGVFGVAPRPTSALLDEVASTGSVPEVDQKMRDNALQDLDYWKGSCIVLTLHPHFEPLRRTLTLLYGPAERISDALVWKSG